MKSIGIIGGLSWESSIEYYRLLNMKIQASLGGVHSAKIVMTSVDFQEYSNHMKDDRWDVIRDSLLNEASRLKSTGVDALALATNTMHIFAGDIEQNTGLPLIHIADSAATAVKSEGKSRVGLLGTKYSMEKGFYRDRLAEKFSIETLIPEEAERERINDYILEEFCRGIFREEAALYIKGIISRLESNGAEGIILGCTEIPLIIKQEDVDIQLYNTTELHVLAIANFMLN